MYRTYWCAIFVTWCGLQAGCDDSGLWYPHSLCRDGYNTYNNRSRAVKISGVNPITSAYSPVKGDLLYSYSSPSHVSIWDGGVTDINGDFTLSGSKGVVCVTTSQRARGGHGSLYGWGRPYYRSKITYHENGGSIANKGNYVKYTEEKGLTLPTPTNGTRKFVGWYTNSGLSGTKVTSISSSERGLKEFWAKWEDLEYDIIYHLNGGSWNGNAGKSKYRSDEGYTLPSNVVKGNDSEFIGWYNDTYTTKKTSIPVGTTGTVHLYARYRAPIEYDTFGGTFSTTPADWYIEGVGYRIPTIIRTGCTLDGWYYDSNYNSKVPNNTIPNTKTGRVRLYARWKATITFNSKIGAWKSAPTRTGATKTMAYYPGTSPLRPGGSNGTTLYNGNELYYEGGWAYFAGWYTGSNIAANTGPLYKIGDFLPTGVWPWTGNITLYARWIGNYYKIYLHATSRGVIDLSNSRNANFRMTSAGEYNRDYQYRYNDNQYDLPLKDTMYRRGHDFIGWYKNSNYTGSKYTQTDKRTGGDKEYYAKWEPIVYNVILYSERGKVKDPQYTFNDLGNYKYRFDGKYTYSDTKDFPLPTQPATIDRRGHDFKGWYDNSAYTGTSYRSIKAETIGDQTFYAKWTPKIYQLVLNKDGATVTNPRIDNGTVVRDQIIGTYTYAKGSTFPVANTDMHKDGSIFAGWYDNKYHIGNYQTGIRSGDDDTAPIGDKEYWARMDKSRS